MYKRLKNLNFLGFLLPFVRILHKPLFTLKSEYSEFCINLICSCNNSSLHIIYDKSLPDEQVLFKKGNKTNGTIPGNHTTSGWNSNTITLEVNKAGSTITCAASNYGTTTINQNTLIEIDLDDYSWGYLFRGKTQYGYCAQSQPKSYYQNIYFSGKGPLKAEAIISKQNNNMLEILNDGLYANIDLAIEEYTSDEIQEIIKEINEAVTSP